MLGKIKGNGNSVLKKKEGKGSKQGNGKMSGREAGNGEVEGKLGQKSNVEKDGDCIRVKGIQNIIFIEEKGSTF